MGDPFSVAGTVVGLTSLGIQVCQSLVDYYTAFRSFHNDIESIVRRIEHTQVILRILERPVEELYREDDPLSEEVWACIAECVRGVKKLESYQKKFGEAEFAPDTLLNKAILVKRRIVYPFEKKTLVDVQRIVDSLLENLQIVLQALQLDTVARFHHQAQEKSVARGQVATAIGRRQIYQTELLEVIDNDVKGITQWTSHHNSNVQQHLHTHSQHLSNIENRVRDLGTLMSQFIQDRSTRPAPSTLKESCDQYVDLIHPTSAVLVDHHRLCQLPASEFRCSCPKNRQRHHSVPHRWISTFRYEESRHLPSCPLYIPTQRSITVGVQVTLFRKCLGYFVESSITWSAGSICPLMKCRNIVSWESPAFLLVDTFSYLIATPRVTEAFNMVVQGFLQLCRNGRAGLYDTTENGHSLAHYVLGALTAFVVDPASRRLLNGASLEGAESGLQALSEAGLEFNTRNSDKWTPLDGFLERLACCLHYSEAVTLRDLQAPILWDMEYSRTGIRRSGYYLMEITSFVPHMMFFRELSLRDALTHGYVEDAVSFSILQQSQPGLLKALGSGHGFIDKDETNDYLCMAADWPQGLRILLDYGIDPDVTNLGGCNSLDEAISYENHDSVSILLNDDRVLITQRTWDCALESRNRDIVRSVAIAAHHRYEVHWEEKAYRGSDTHQNRPRHHVLFPQVYYSRCLTSDLAQIIYDAGFENVDADCSHHGRPLWYHAYGKINLDHFILFGWLVKKGARLDAAHERWKTMPVHLIAEKIALASITDWYGDIVKEEDTRLAELVSSYMERGPANAVFHPTIESPGSASEQPGTIKAETTSPYSVRALSDPARFVRTLLTSRQIDTCTCSCSLKGCTVISSALKVVRQSAYGRQRIPYYRLGQITSASRLQKRVLSAFVDLLSSYDISDESFQQEVIRIMTFEALELTHTCHDHRHNVYWESKPRDPMLKAEIEDIQFIEKADLDLLEDLVADFNQALQEYEGIFFDFIQGPWSERMEEVLAKQNTPKEGEEEKITEIGVVLKEYWPKQPKLPHASRKPKAGTWEWFEMRVRKIMDGSYADDPDWYFW